MRHLLVLALTLLAVACAQPPAPIPTPAAAPEAAPHLVLKPARFADLPGWGRDHWAAALPALQKSCVRMMNQSPDQALGSDHSLGTYRDWLGACGAVNRVPSGDDEAARQFFEDWFTPWQATDNDRTEGTFTGYYEPEVAGSTSRHDHFTVPLLGKPRDLITIDLARLRPDLAQKAGNEILAGRLGAGGRIDPYPTRSEIETKGLGENAAPLYWLDDAVAAHILHIQGGGRVRLENGQMVRVAVAGTNGQRFVGLGRILADHGLVASGAGMPEIRDWLLAHPAQAKDLMAENPRYVFYRALDGDGPIGSQGIALTPERSMAVDTRFIPLGVPLWLDSRDGAGTVLQRLLVAQDTGSAIKGPVRGDYFWGGGETAFQQAGRMKSSGKMWLLLPRMRSPRLAGLE